MALTEKRDMLGTMIAGVRRGEMVRRRMVYWGGSEHLG